MFCGVGPLSVKAAVKRPKLKVLANDLNPEGVEFLKRNIKMNKIEKRVLPFNLDARAFLRMLVDKDDHSEAKLSVPRDFLRFDHCYMNLPVDAVEFLDCFIGVFKKADKEIWLRPGETEITLPLIHVYGFTFEPDREKALAFFVDRIGKAMGFPQFNADMVMSFHNIRDVSSKSSMYSTTFRLPAEVAFAELKSDIYEEFKDTAVPEKRPKLN
jgi:tRNA (guanine37-N1)-methyltransferase